MIRKIIRIDGEKCDGCGLCAAACHEGALALIDGKAKLLREDYCDGLGTCLPACPAGAIAFEERDAKAYDVEAARMNMKGKPGETPPPGGCPGSNAQRIKRNIPPAIGHTGIVQSRLTHWPVQIKLVPVKAPYLNEPPPPFRAGSRPLELYLSEPVCSNCFSRL
ncbi:MAG: 4Fe-4S binding protein [Spirochaetaceae bacterium]|nr:4Fe-4S binding protein [Spirochaetaceae bacterium]